MCDSTGDTFYGPLMTDDALMVLANGAVMDRDAVVEALGQSPPWRKYDISDVRLVRTGSDSASLVYVGTAYGEEEEPVFVGAMSSVYVREGDDWRLALYQQTQLPDATD
ncbi:MAG: nuclear transport factor 2 family protein [Geodermatophilaceae bacterium]